MKKIVALILASTVLLTACGDPRSLPTGPKGEMKEYPTYGLFNQGSSKSDKVCYELIIGNVVWSIVLIETIIAPVYFLGFSLFEPVGLKGENGCGIDNMDSK